MTRSSQRKIAGRPAAASGRLRPFHERVERLAGQATDDLHRNRDPLVGHTRQLPKGSGESLGQVDGMFLVGIGEQ